MSTNILIAYDNYLADDTTVLTATTASSNYPVANIADYKSWKRTWLTEAAWDIEIDFGYARSVDFVALINTNNLGGSVTLKGNTAATWAAPAYSSSVTMNSPGNGYKYIATAQEYRYWQLSYSGAGTMVVHYGGAVLAGSYSAYPKIGEVFFGTAVEMSQNFSIGYSREEQYRTLANMSEFGAADAVNLVDHRRNVFNLAWKYADTTTRAQLRALQDAVKGKAYPFVVVPDHDTDNACYYVRMQDSRRFGHAGGFQFDDLGQESLVLIEELNVLEGA